MAKVNLSKPATGGAKALPEVRQPGAAPSKPNLAVAEKGADSFAPETKGRGDLPLGGAAPPNALAKDYMAPALDGASRTWVVVPSDEDLEGAMPLRFSGKPGDAPPAPALKAGGTAVVVFDPARFPSDLAVSHGGYPTSGVYVRATVARDGAPDDVYTCPAAGNVVVAGRPTHEMEGVPVIVPLPAEAKELRVDFILMGGGRQVMDGGYRFPVTGSRPAQPQEPGPRPFAPVLRDLRFFAPQDRARASVLEFPANRAPSAATVKAGRPVLVRWAPERSGYANNRWSADLFLRFHPGEDVQSPLVQGGGGGKPAEALFDVPAGTTRIEMWIASRDRGVAEPHYDSNLGKNFVFDVVP